MVQYLRALPALPEDPGFHSQYPHGSSQPSATPVPGDLTPSGLHGHQACMCAQTYMQEKCPYTQNRNKYIFLKREMKGLLLR